jgi:hypothetical protein
MNPDEEYNANFDFVKQYGHLISQDGPKKNTSKTNNKIKVSETFENSKYL